MTNEDKNDTPQQDSELEQQLETTVPPDEPSASGSGLVDLPLSRLWTGWRSSLIVSQSRPASIRLRKAFWRAYIPLVGPSRPGESTGPISSTGIVRIQMDSVDGSRQSPFPVG